MAARAWFKAWGKESLASVDLASLTDHEERVWWRLLCVASQRDDWSAPMDAGLARLCASTPAKLRRAVTRLAALGMVTERGHLVAIANWERYQETPAAARMRRYRADTSNVKVTNSAGTPSVTVTPNVTTEAEAEAEADHTPVGVCVADKPPPRTRTRKMQAEFVPLTDAERVKLHERWDSRWPPGEVDERIDLALRHDAAARYPTGQYQYANNWLRRDSEQEGNRGTIRQTNGAGSGNPSRDGPQPGSMYAQLAAAGRLRDTGG